MRLDDIAFLERFRDRIAAFLVAGAAPTQDPIWGSAGLTKMKEAARDPEFRALRQDIIHMKGRAARMLEDLGIGCTFEQYPPPAVGGPAVKFPLFDLITDNRSLHTIDGAVFIDKIDQAIGLLQTDGQSDLEQAVPIFAIRDLDRALNFYVERLGFICQRRSPSTARVARGSALLLLRADGAPGARGAAFLRAADAAALAAEFAAKGVRVTEPSGEEQLGVEVRDPDGNALFFGRLD